jgi:transcriptional regulator with XRE-family HTH domain
MADHLLRVHREKKGLSQAALAQAMGVDRTYISLVESNRRQGPLEFWLKAAKALSTTVDDLMVSGDILDIGGN